MDILHRLRLKVIQSFRDWIYLSLKVYTGGPCKRTAVQQCMMTEAEEGLVCGFRWKGRDERVWVFETESKCDVQIISRSSQNFLPLQILKAEVGYSVQSLVVDMACKTDRHTNNAFSLFCDTDDITIKIGSNEIWTLSCNSVWSVVGGRHYFPEHSTTDGIEVELQRQSFLISSSDGDKWSTWRSGWFSVRESVIGTHSIGEWLRHRRCVQFGEKNIVIAENCTKIPRSYSH